MFPISKLNLPDEVGQVANSLDSEYYILQAGDPKVFLIDEEARDLVEEDRGSGRRGDSGRNTFNVEEEFIETETVNDISEAREEVTESPEVEFSTIKLDLTSLAFVLDRRSGARRLQTEDILRPTDPSTTSGPQEEELLGDSLEVNPAGKVPTSDYQISEDYDEAIEDIPADEAEEVEDILNTEIFRKEIKPSVERSGIEDIGSTSSSERSAIISSTAPPSSTTEIHLTRQTSRARFPVRKPPRRSRIGFNRGSVEARPGSVKRGEERRKSSATLNRSKSFPEPSDKLSAAIPLISVWIMNHIKSDPSLTCRDIPSVLTQLLEDNRELMEGGEVDTDILRSAEKMTALLVNLINKQEQSENRVETENKDSVHGDDVKRRRNRERIRNIL